MEKEYINRLFDKELDFYLKTVGAVQIVGPKFCGKSRTAKRHAKTVVDLMKQKDREQYIPLAKTAPDVFLNMGEKPMLIDEWQVISFIWNSLKEAIDSNGGFGQYILTGSVTDNTIDETLAGQQNEQHTGTGRIIKRMMRPMSLFESGDSTGAVSLSELERGVFKPTICQKSISDYAFLICRGGWPLAIDEDSDVALQQAKTFYSGLVGRDIFSLQDVPLRRDEGRAKRVVRAYARSIASQTSNETMKADVSANGDPIDKDTFVKYLLAMQRLYVIEELEAWNPNLRSKAAIRGKNTRHFVDPSIATSALGVTPESIFRDMKTFGLLFESIAIRDLRIYCDSIGADLYHYRDNLDREADAVIVFPDGSWALVEIKLGDTDAISSASKKLVALANDINIKEHPKPAFLLIITGLNVAYKDENGVYVVPLGCLRN